MPPKVSATTSPSALAVNLYQTVLPAGAQEGWGSATSVVAPTVLIPIGSLTKGRSALVRGTASAKSSFAGWANTGLVEAVAPPRSATMLASTARAMTIDVFMLDPYRGAPA